MELFKEINKKYNKTIVQVTHSGEASKYGTRLIRLVDGQIQSDDGQAVSKMNIAG